MSQTAVVHARIDAATKNATEEILDAIGMTPTEAIRLFYRQIALRKQFPVELHLPNRLTASTLDKSDQDKGVERFNNLHALYASWEG